MIVLTLPRLVSGRDLASTMVRALGDVRDNEVVVDARATATGTGSFAARLVRDIIVNNSAKRLIVVGAPAELDGFFEESAGKLGVGDRIELNRSMPAAAST